MSLRVLVCGGRDYHDHAEVYRVLDLVDRKRGITTIIHGAAKGADLIGSAWAQDRDKDEAPFPADWSLGRKAGPVRNQYMLDEGKPDVVIAFPGGRGTADMVSRAKRAGVKVWKPVPEPPPTPPHDVPRGTENP